MFREYLSTPGIKSLYFIDSSVDGSDGLSDNNQPPLDTGHSGGWKVSRKQHSSTRLDVFLCIKHPTLKAFCWISIVCKNVCKSVLKTK